MEIEQLEIRDFIRQCRPLGLLSEDDLDELSGSLEIAYRRDGETILEAGQPNAELYIVRSGAVEVVDKEGKLCGQLDVRSWFGYSAVMGDGVMARNINAIEDCLLYIIPGQVFHDIVEKYDGIAQYFSERKSTRLRQAVSSYRSEHHAQMFSSKVREVTNSPATLIAGDTSIKQAARAMSDEGKTSVLVAEDSELVGIVTEREFCKRVVAVGLDTSRPISEIMTKKPITIRGSMPASEALLLMGRHNIHHLPFKLNKKEYAVVTGSDLIQFQSQNPLYMINDVCKASSIDELVTLSEKLPSMLIDLVRSSLTAYDIGHLISSFSSAINQRLLMLAEEEFGEPPVPYAWVVAGSMARGEQTAHSDQDNAMILSDDYQPDIHATYFASLAKYVSDGLARCGYVYCPGDVMATNPKWRVTQSEWRAYFDQWVMAPEKKSLMYVSIFFDLRCIYGEEKLLKSIIKKVLKKTQGNQRFLTNLADNALDRRPPIGLFRNFVLEAGGAEEKALNLKKRGVIPVTDLARVYALSSGIKDLHTEDRLRAAKAKGELSKRGTADLIDAYEFIGSVRLQHQCLQIERGEAADNFVPPELLSNLERRHLKDAFEVVSTMQKALKQRYS